MSVPSASRLASAPSSADKSSGPQVTPISRLLQSRKVPARKKPAAEFNRLRQNLDRAFRQAGDGLARGQLGVEMDDRLAAFGLGKQHRVRPACHDGVEIGVGHAGVEAVDAHQQARALLCWPVGFEKLQCGGARLRLALGRD